MERFLPHPDKILLRARRGRILSFGVAALLMATLGGCWRLECVLGTMGVTDVGETPREVLNRVPGLFDRIRPDMDDKQVLEVLGLAAHPELLAGSPWWGSTRTGSHGQFLDPERCRGYRLFLTKSWRTGKVSSVHFVGPDTKQHWEAP